MRKQELVVVVGVVAVRQRVVNIGILAQAEESSLQVAGLATNSRRQERGRGGKAR